MEIIHYIAGGGKEGGREKGERRGGSTISLKTKLRRGEKSRVSYKSLVIAMYRLPTHNGTFYFSLYIYSFHLYIPSWSLVKLPRGWRNFKVFWQDTARCSGCVFKWDILGKREREKGYLSKWLTFSLNFSCRYFKEQRDRYFFCSMSTN